MHPQNPCLRRSAWVDPIADLWNSVSPCIYAAKNEIAQQAEWLSGRFCENSLSTAAQNLRHTPVDELHLIENKGDKIANDFLTFFLVAVQQPRSLTVSKVFPVGGESGAQTSSLRPSTELEVISESGDGSCWRPGTAVPRREGENSCISFFRTAVLGREPSLAPAKATGPGERNSSGARLSQDN